MRAAISNVPQEALQALLDAPVIAQLRVLHLEGSDETAEMIRACLERDGMGVQIELARTRAQLLAALTKHPFDLVLADCQLSDPAGLAVLKHVRNQYPDLPVILVLGGLGEAGAILGLKHGATDYVLKARPDRLPAAIRRAVSEAERSRGQRQIQADWREAQNFFQSIMTQREDFVAVLDLSGRRVFCSPSYCRLLGHSDLTGMDSFKDIHPEDVARVREIFTRTAASGVGERAEYRLVLADGQIRHLESQGSVVRNQRGQITHVLVLSRDITERKMIERQLMETREELLAVSRLAGMAEVATGVLHNVGNVLSSVNVTSHYLADCLRNSKAQRLARVAGLLRERESDLPGFFAGRQGRQLPAYLTELADCLTAEQVETLAELQRLQKSIEHLITIVSMQQRFAQTSGYLESVQVTELLEDALLLNATSLERDPIRIVKEFAPVPPITVPKHQVLQILVNLIRNAQFACKDADRDDKQMTLRVMGHAGSVSISVSDNGIGILPENRDRIFAHGFTTRKGGHGFGLHSGALAAKDMGGSLRVFSAGAGHGATFTLEIPTARAGIRPGQLD